jgi:hypothetical protein
VHQIKDPQEALWPNSFYVLLTALAGSILSQRRVLRISDGTDATGSVGARVMWPTVFGSVAAGYWYPSSTGKIAARGLDQFVTPEERLAMRDRLAANVDSVLEWPGRAVASVEQSISVSISDAQKSVTALTESLSAPKKE